MLPLEGDPQTPFAAPQQGLSGAEEPVGNHRRGKSGKSALVSNPIFQPGRRLLATPITPMRRHLRVGNHDRFGSTCVARPLFGRVSSSSQCRRDTRVLVLRVHAIPDSGRHPTGDQYFSFPNQRRDRCATPAIAPRKTARMARNACPSTSLSGLKSETPNAATFE